MTMLMRTSLAMIRQAAQARTALYACGAAQNPLAMPAYGVADAGIQNRTRCVTGRCSTERSLLTLLGMIAFSLQEHWRRGARVLGQALEVH